MTNKQENKLTMYETVLQLFTDFPAIVAIIVAFANAATSFTGKLTALQSKVALQTAIITGVAVAKKARKKALVDTLMIVIGALRAYAKVINDDELLNFVKYSRSKLMKQADTTLEQLANNLYDKANSLVASLGSYGIDAAFLLMFQGKISDYSIFVPKTRTVRITKKTVTKSIKDLIKDIDDILHNQLDALVIQHLSANPDFYNDYLSARMIIDLGSHHSHVPYTITSGQIINIRHDLVAGQINGKKIKNTSSSVAITLNVYFASSSGQGWTGIGITLNPGEEKVLNELFMGTPQAFLNVQNMSGGNGSFDVIGF